MTAWFWSLVLYLQMQPFTAFLIFGLSGWIGVKCMDGGKVIQCVGWICLAASLSVVLLYVIGMFTSPTSI